MNHKELDNITWYLLSISVIISVLLVSIGGILYLREFGNTLYAPLVYTPQKIFAFNLSRLGHDLVNLSANAFIEAGLLVLAFTQILRVFTVGSYFISLRDKPFIGISIFIFVLLVCSFFIPIW